MCESVAFIVMTLAFSHSYKFCQWWASHFSCVVFISKLQKACRAHILEIALA